MPEQRGGESRPACLELALQAPTAADQQNWRWGRVTDPGVRKVIAEQYRNANKGFVRSELDGLGPGPQQRRLESVLHLVEHLGEVPVLVAAYAVEPDLDRPERQPVPPAPPSSCGRRNRVSHRFQALCRDA